MNVKITRNEFHDLSTGQQVEYINYFAVKYSGEEFVKINSDGDVIDIFTDEVIDNLWDYATDLDHEYTDLHGKLFN